jgi:hypothetical protein
LCGVADRGDATRLLLDAVETSSENDAILEVDSDHSRVDERSNGGRKAVIVSDLVREPSTRRETFRTMWAAHNGRKHDRGVKGIHYPLVGDVTFAYEGMELAADPGLSLAHGPSRR